MTELLIILMSWASLLSGYPMPEHMPEFRYVSNQFFVTYACGGKECKVHGWYNDAGTVYISRDLAEDEQAHVIVHEFVHYLQDLSGKFDTDSCADSLIRERESYAVQNKYLMEGLARIQWIKPGPTMCVKGLAGEL